MHVWAVFSTDDDLTEVDLCQFYFFVLFLLEDERLSNLLRRVEEKVERRKNRKTKNKERFRKLLLRVNKIAEAIRQIAGTNGTDVNAT